MTYINAHCNRCNTNFDLEIDSHGCALGVCNCQDVGEDLRLGDTILRWIESEEYRLEKVRACKK